MTIQQTQKLLPWRRPDLRRRARDAWVRLIEPQLWKHPFWADQIVFICGCGHSGTTLTLRILGAHPAVYTPERETEAFLHPHEQWMRLHALRRDVVASGKRLVVEKTPFHIRRLDAIRKAVPGARFVVPVRDGRDVAASHGRRFRGDFQYGIDRWLKDCGIIARESEARDLMWFRYEDLVANPADVTASLCSFLGIEFSEAMLRYYERPGSWQGRKGRYHDDPTEGPGHQELRAWQANQPIFNGCGTWKNELPPEAVEIFEHGAGAPLMRRFGYL